MRKFSLFIDNERRIRLAVVHLLVQDDDKMMVFQIWGPSSQQLEALTKKIISSVRFQ